MQVEDLFLSETRDERRETRDERRETRDEREMVEREMVG
jgi:hypothetical protein